MSSLVVADCPGCRGVGTVFLGTCEVCFAEFFPEEDDRSRSDADAVRPGSGRLLVG